MVRARRFGGVVRDIPVVECLNKEYRIEYKKTKGSAATFRLRKALELESLDKDYGIENIKNGIPPPGARRCKV